MALYELQHELELSSPVLVVALEGWVDAGFGSAGALAALLADTTTEVVATFDADALIDFRARRPTLSLVDGVISELSWPRIELRAGQDRAGHDLLVLSGPEPDMRWHAFCRDVQALAAHAGVRLTVGLGAFPAPVPHTRPTRLASTATTPELAAAVGFVPGSIEVPAGIQAAIEQALADAGLPAVGLWARVPHYVAAFPYPAASAALLEGLGAVADVQADADGLRTAASLTRTRVDELVAGNDEHQAMVRQLEGAYDSEDPGAGRAAAAGLAGLDPADLPSGDEIAAELERYLRGDS